MSKELTWEHLAAYLPHYLRVQGRMSGSVRQLSALSKHELRCDGMDEWDDISSYQPVLVPVNRIRSIVKEIYVKQGFKGVLIEQIKGSLIADYKIKGDTYWDVIHTRGDFGTCPAFVYNELLKRHVDVHGLINDNLAISK